MASGQGPENLDTGELSLRCAEFFMSLSEMCYQYYHAYQASKDRKTKQIAKSRKERVKKKKVPGTDNQSKDEQELRRRLPKKPITAYIIYFQEKKPEFVKKHPDLSLSDLTKLIGMEWQEIDQHEKKPYLEQAQEDRKRFEEQMKEFKLRYGPATALDNSQSSFASLPNAPSCSQSKIIGHEGSEEEHPQLQQLNDEKMGPE